MFSKMYLKAFSTVFSAGLILLLLGAQATADTSDNVIVDGDISISKVELENAMKYWPAAAREQAVTKDGVRFDLINQFLVNRKIADKMDQIDAGKDEEFYWQQKFALRNIQNKLFQDQYKKTLDVPDMTALAKEQLHASRDIYAVTPEERKASHILIECRAGSDCDRNVKRVEATEILKELNSGASFEEMVEKHSDDPGSKARKGKLPKWMSLGQTKMDPYFVEGVFSIKEKGGYSDVVETRFGLHIIRLDDHKEKKYRPNEKVLPGLISSLEKKYRNLSQLAMMKSLGISDNAKIDDKIVTELLSKYKTESAEKAEAGKLIIKKITRP